MGKRILLAAVLVVGALLAYNYVTTGKLALIPTATLSEEEKEINALEKELKRAVTQYAQAGRAAGLSGVDTTSQAETARLEVEKVQKRLKEMQKKASAEIRARMEQLQQKLDEAKREIGIR